MRHLIAFAAAALLAWPSSPRAEPRPAPVPSVGIEHAAWKLLAGPVDPPQMSGHAVIRDPVRHRVLVVDGTSPGEVWELSLPGAGSPRWKRRAASGPELPALRSHFAAVLDSARDRILVFGGRQLYEAYNDLWAISLDDEHRWTRLQPEGEPPSPRFQTAAAFDPLRDRVIFFGGDTLKSGAGHGLLSETWSLELTGMTRWVRLSPQGAPPSRRKAASAVYDRWSDRMIVFGGWEPYNLPPPIFVESTRPCNDTWALSLSGTPAWQRLEATSPPPIRYAHVAVVDPIGQRMIISGGDGYQLSYSMDDTWALPIGPGTTPTWSQLPTTGTVPFAMEHGAVFSPERSRLVQFGGGGNGNGTFELNLESAVWTQIQSDAPEHFPSRRILPTLLADPTGERLLLFGGGWGCQHDLWSFASGDTPDWTNLPTTGIAPVCMAPHFVHDAARNRLLAFHGGHVASWGQVLDQVWAMNLDEPRVWTRLDVAGPHPPGRGHYSLVYDPVRDRVLLFGGASYYTRADSYGYDRDDLWSLSLSDLKWSELHPVNTPGARRKHWAAYDPRDDRMLLVGGEGALPRANWLVPSCWSLALSGDSLRWSPLGPDVPVVQPAALDPLRNRLVLWDGVSVAWTLALDDPRAWTPLSLSGDLPVARYDYGLTYDAAEDRFVIFGGNVGLLKADLYALRFSDEVAVEVHPRGPDGLLPLRSHGKIEAAILGSRTFAVDSVLPSSVRLAGAQAMTGGRGREPQALHDVNRDHFDDLVLRFAVDSMEIGPRDTVLWLVGRTPNFGIRAFVPVRVVPGDRRTGRHLERLVSAGSLSLAPATPVTSTLGVRFSLASAADARIEVYDVAGRRMLARDLRGLAPGAHALQFERGLLAPGLYLVRLVQGQQSAVARAVVLR